MSHLPHSEPYFCLLCALLLQTPVLFPAPSIFGGAGFGFGGGGSVFGQKCQKVTTAQLQPVVAAAANPQWTCGIIVDGNLSCQSESPSFGSVRA